MRQSALERQIDRSRRRLARLRERAEREDGSLDSPLREAVEELGETLEELSVTMEELASTNEELAEAQLASEEHARRYLDLFRAAPDAYVVTDDRGVIRELNEVAEEKLGRPSRHLAGKPLLPLVAAADRDAFLAILSTLQTRRVRLDDRLIRMGSEPGFDASVSAVPERRGDELEIRWTLRDVTDRHRAERALQASESRMRSLAHSLRVPISYVGRDQRYRFNNAAYEEWFGVPAEKLRGTTVQELLGEEAYRRLRPRIERVLAGEPQVFEAELPFARGGPRDVIVEYEPDVAADGRVMGFYALVTDVSAARRAERKARAAEARTRAVLDAAQDGILSVDAAGAIHSVNPALCKMFGYPPGELSGHEATRLWMAPTGNPQGHSLADLVGPVRELTGVRRDGRRFPIQISVGTASLEEGPGFVATVRDLSGQRTLESQLRAAAAAATVAEDRERRRLAADLHDEVSQLLTLAGMKLGAMRGGAADTGLAPQLAEVEDLLTRAHQRTESLTFQLSPPVLHDMGLAAAAEWLAEEMERSYGLHVHVRHCAEPALAEEVRITLFRALRELLINVARHAQTGGARILMDQADDRVRLVVEDEGVGFDPEREPPGYGLFSIRQRLRHLAGEMEIEAVPGDGTRVILTAPLSAETAAGGREP